MKYIKINDKEIQCARFRITFLVGVQILASKLFAPVAGFSSAEMREGVAVFLAGLRLCNIFFNFFGGGAIVSMLARPFLEFIKVGMNTSSLVRSTFSTPEEFQAAIEKNDPNIGILIMLTKTHFTIRAADAINQYGPFLEAIWLVWGFALAVFSNQPVAFVVPFAAAVFSAYMRDAIHKALKRAVAMPQTRRNTIF